MLDVWIYSFIVDVNVIVYIRGQIWQHRKPDHLTDFWSASLQRSWGVSCHTDLLQMCCLVCLNMMSSIKDMLAGVDVKKWGQSTTFHPLHPSCGSQCGIPALLKGEENSCSHKKTQTQPKIVHRQKDAAMTVKTITASG